ncbi:MAG TPA: PAS domain S-box protein [bacterium]|nr:PAS domain S-box protein [bacterium]
MALNPNLLSTSPFFTFSPDLLADLDGNGLFLSANPAWEKQLGFPPQDLLGRPFLDQLHVEDRPKALLEIKRLSRGKQPTVLFETRVQDAQKETHWIAWTFSANPDPGAEGWFLIGQEKTQVKRLEKALEETQEKFQKLSDSSEEGVAIHEKGVIREANQALARLFGYEQASQMVGKMGPELADGPSQELIRRQIQSRSEAPYEITALRRDGSPFPCRVRSREILYQGRSMRVSTFLDLTPLREREKEILESEEKFRRLAEAATEGIGITLNGKILEVNQALADIFGYAPSEMIGRSALEFTAPESRDKLISMVMSGSEVPYEAVGLRKDGRRLHMEISGRMVFFRGHLVRVAVFKDLSRQKRAEAALSQSEAHLRAVFNSGVHSMVVLDVQGRLQALNARAQREMVEVLGRKGEVGRWLGDYLPPELLAIFQENFQKSLEGQTLRFERRIAARDGVPHWFEFQYHPVLDEGGRVTSVCVSSLGIDDRKRADETLRRSEEWFRRLFEGSSVGMTLVAPDKTFFHVNQAFCQMVGYSQEELSKLTFRDITDPADLEDNIRLGQDLPQGRGFQMQKRYRHKDGGVVWANITVTPFHDEKGQFLHTLGIIENITEQKRVEAGIRESEERYRRLVEFSPDAIFVYVKDKIVFANSAALKLLGARGPDQLVGRPILSLVHPDDQAVVGKRVENVLLNRGENPRLEQKFVRLDGQVLEVEAQGTFFNYMGRPAGLMIARDISQRQKAIRAFRESQESYRRLVEFFPETVLVHSEGKLLYINPPGLKMFGASQPGEMLGRSVLDFVSTPFLETARIRMESIYLNKLSTDPMDQVWLRLDGAPIDVEIRGTFFNFMGKPSILSILRNVSERKRTQQMLLRYERLAAVGQVIAGIAHDIRNPLAVLSAMTLHLREKFEDEGGKSSLVAKDVETITTQTNRLKRLMNDILDYAKGLTLVKQPIEPRAFLEQSLKLVQAQLGAAPPSVEIEWRLEKDAEPFWGDRERLEQVFLNLILNAYEALEGGGTLTLSFESAPGEVLLKVEDDGPGIPEGALSRLFEPFFTTKKYGSGLGLSVSQKIVEAHGGKIEAEWVYPHGTLFTVRLPREKP